MSEEKTLKEQEAHIRKIVNKDAHKQLMILYHWLYVNHKDILREYEKSQKFKYRIEFLGGEK